MENTIPARPRLVERHLTASGLTATDALKVGCPHCGGSESAVVRRLNRVVAAVQCPACGAVKSTVVKSRGRITVDAIRRLRECASCGHRFATFETAEQATTEQEPAA